MSQLFLRDHSYTLTIDWSVSSRDACVDMPNKVQHKVIMRLVKGLSYLQRKAHVVFTVTVFFSMFAQD